MSIFKTISLAQTRKIGQAIGQQLKAGDVVALTGELGAGKTTLVKGIAHGLGVKKADETVSSPTFTLIHEYAGREKVYHLDWYRLARVEGEDAFLAEECMRSGGVCLIEWAERGRNLLPAKHLKITMKHAGPSSRQIEVK
ncbi:MAG: tRNA (adenosine(37)-N6)-threonylcarbamoyltransferase complex ATPase subunit type 1 TsaE [Candidatus Omnitrophica bacterium]|nr:tRNA (adenosine(37)-N6)-threonylcarbamoyltransferase complex ATPase subunit type 1 TsaE [Candidatus Omnitrophota bacterium]